MGNNREENEDVEDRGSKIEDRLRRYGLALRSSIFDRLLWSTSNFIAESV